MSKTQKVMLAIGIILAIWILRDPTGAGEFGEQVIAWLKDGLDAIITFLKTIVN